MINFTRFIRTFLSTFTITVDILFGRYPSFVYGKPIAEGEVPAFCFHEAGIEWLEPMLQYLKKKGYQNRTAEEFLNENRHALPELL